MEYECATCAYYNTDRDDMPCCSCVDYENWEEREAMRKCPFCGRKVALVYPWLHYFEEDKMWAFNHFCKTSDTDSHFGVCFMAKTKKEIIDRWNGKTD